MESNNDMSLAGEKSERHRSKHRKYSGHKKRRRSPIRKAMHWIRKNPNKTIAVILAVVIVYVTYLFIMYALEHPRKRNITSHVMPPAQILVQRDVKVLKM